MTPDEAARIKEAAITNGRQQRRSQGIPEQIKSSVTTARLAALLRDGGPR